MIPARSLVMLASGLVGMALIVLAFSSQGADAGNVIELDTYRADNSEAFATGPVLEAGREYIITITGTYSFWFASDWESQGVCPGETPEDMPMFPSPGTANGRVGDDAVWHFAGPNNFSDCNAPDVGDFVMSFDGGNTRVEVEADDAGSAANPQHTYHFTVTGQGENVVFFIEDSKSEDNYGIFHITIEDAPEPQTQLWGDNDCSGAIDAADMIRVLTHLSAPAAGDEIEGCPGLSDAIDLFDIHATGAGSYKWGDVGCSGVLDAVDALAVVLYAAELPLPEESCPGDSLVVGAEVEFARQ